MIKKNQNITELISSLNYTFLDYFYIFGLNTETIISNYLYNLTKYEGEHEKIKPTLISKFPPFNKTQSNIDEKIILQHCFSDGFKLIEHICPPKNEIFHFSLDNLKYKNKKIYFTCLLFYEQLSSYYECKQYYENLNIKNDFNKNNENLNDNIKNNNLNNNIFDNKENIFESGKNYISHIQSAKEIKNYSHSLNELFTLKEKNNNNNIINNNQEIKISKENYFNSIYIPKVICLSSKCPFPEEKSIILKLLLRYILDKEERNIPIEKIIENLMLEIPFPPKGIYGFKYELNNMKLLIKQSPLNKNQILSYKMQYIFSFQIIDIIRIFQYMILEYPILFFSNNKEKLTNVIESFISFLYPLKYQYPYISILPNINSSMIENEECFIFGINQTFNMKIFESFNINLLNKYILICNIDLGKVNLYCDKKNPLKLIKLKDLRKLEFKTENGKNEIILSEEINKENHNNIKKIELPFYYTDKLLNRLEELLKNNQLKINSNSDEYNEKISIEIQEIFFYYIVSILNLYNNYLYNEEKEVIEICKKIKCDNVNLNDLWKEKEFFENVKNEEKEFYNAFFKTKIFLDFLKRKYYHEFNEEELEFWYFDEKIAFKRNKGFLSKNIKTFFLNILGLNIEIINEIPKYNNFNDYEINYISNNTLLLSKYFQKYDNSKSIFHYFLFPKLIYDNIFFNKKYFNNQLKYPSLEFEKEYSLLLKNILLKRDYNEFYKGLFIKQFHYNDSIFHFKNEINDSIFLIWFIIFSMTFYYNENIEKKIRFYEMLENLNKFTFKDNIIYSILFNCLYKYGTEYMLIKFYNIIKHNYIHYSYLTSKLEKISFQKSFTKKLSIATTDIIYYKEIDNDKLFELNEDINQKLKKRTFGFENEEIKFQIKLTCNYCKTEFDFTLISMNFDSLNKKLMTCPCPECKKEINPEIKVKFDNYKIDKFQLFSPWYIYKYYCPKLLNENGLKLNLKKFRIEYKNLFWNCIWYFMIKGLNYDILLEYKKNSILKKKESLINYNIGDYAYDNNLYSFDNIEIEENVINISI